MEQKIIVVAGGVGPQSGLRIHEHILENTLAEGTDQGHLDVFHFSRPGAIPDRTEALVSSQPMAAVTGMLRTFEIAEAAVARSGSQAVGAILCNTFHAPPLMTPFLRLKKRKALGIQLLHMVDETLDYIETHHRHCGVVGVMSTNGTRQFRVYEKGLHRRGFDVVQVSPGMQRELHESICHPQWGIKSKTTLDEKVRHHFLAYVDCLVSCGAELIILGCTEIPLALPEPAMHNIPLIDPLKVLARALIREAAPHKLKGSRIPLDQTATA